MTTPKKEKPKHLGRGLESLMGPIISTMEENVAASASSEVSNYIPDKELQINIIELSLDDIAPNPYQPRQAWNEEQLCELADSIKENGIIQPIIVRQKGN